MFDWDGHHHPFGRERVTPMVVLAAWPNWWSAPATSAWTNASATTRALPALVVWREAAVQAWRLAAAWMLAATEGTVNATGCPWPICGHENTRTPLGHMQPFQTYLCRVRKGSGSSPVLFRCSWYPFWWRQEWHIWLFCFSHLAIVNVANWRAVSLFQQHLSGVEVDIKCHHQLNEENEKGLSAQNAATWTFDKHNTLHTTSNLFADLCQGEHEVAKLSCWDEMVTHGNISFIFNRAIEIWSAQQQCPHHWQFQHLLSAISWLESVCWRSGSKSG